MGSRRITIILVRNPWWLQYLKVRKPTSPRRGVLGPRRADAVLLVATTMKPSKRLGFEAGGKAWYNAAARVYAQHVGIAITTGGGSFGSSSKRCSKALLKFRAKQYEFAQQQFFCNFYFTFRIVSLSPCANEPTLLCVTYLGLGPTHIRLVWGDRYGHGAAGPHEGLRE
jgi:Fatty acid synthase subunit alpha Acyl carrier domain